MREHAASVVILLAAASTRPVRSSLKGPALVVTGVALGSAVGILPGTGPATSALMATALEKRIARDPDRFGKGAVEGIASPEAANTASVQAAFIPTLSLGVPGDAIIAILLGAVMIHGIVPGPRFITDHPRDLLGAGRQLLDRQHPAAAAGLHPRPVDEGAPEARAADLARRCRRVCRTPDQRRVHGADGAGSGDVVADRGAANSCAASRREAGRRRICDPVPASGGQGAA